jgi:hypothetical protein
MLGLRYRSFVSRLKFNFIPPKSLTRKSLKTQFKLPWFIKALCGATAEILFLRGVAIGAVLLTAMLLQPGVFIFGFFGVFFPHVF